MQRIFIPLFFLFASFSCFGQSNIQVGLRTGPSFPMFQYKGTNLNNDSAGFAGQGWNYSAQASWFFHEMLGVQASGGLQTHPIQTNKLKEAYKNEYNAEEVTVEAGDFQTQLYQLGPVFQYPVTDKIRLQAKLLAGILIGLNPESTITIEKDNSPTVFETTFAQATAFTINPGLGGFYKTGENVEAGLTVEYAGAVPQFEYTDKAGETVTTSQPMRFLNINIGVNYYLN